MKRTIALAVALWIFSATFAFAVVKHSGPTKRIVSYNNSHYEEPAPEREISRTEPSKPPIILVRVEWNGTCLQMIHATTGNTMWEICF